MVLVYLGKNRRLGELVERHKSVITRNLQRIFGQSYPTISSDAERLLTPDCFYDSAERVEELLGTPLRSQSGVCKIEFGTDLDFRKDSYGKLRAGKCQVGYGFHVLDDQKQDLSERVFISYIHNYCRFLISLTQDVPMFLAMTALNERTSQNENGSDLMKYAASLNHSPKSLNEKIRILIMKNVSLYLWELLDKSASILEEKVIYGTGIPVNNPWRGKSREYDKITIPRIIEFSVSKGGDPFLGMKDNDIFDFVRKWERFLMESTSNPYLKNLYESLGELEIKTLPLEELRRSSI